MFKRILIHKAYCKLVDLVLCLLLPWTLIFRGVGAFLRGPAPEIKAFSLFFLPPFEVMFLFLAKKKLKTKASKGERLRNANINNSRYFSSLNDVSHCVLGLMYVFLNARSWSRSKTYRKFHPVLYFNQMGCNYDGFKKGTFVIHGCWCCSTQLAFFTRIFKFFSYYL